MSKLSVRVVLSVLLSLGVIFAIYTTVQSASLGAAVEKVGSHSVSGVMTNFNHDRFTIAEQEASQPELQPYDKSSNSQGHDCPSESSNSPID